MKKTLIFLSILFLISACSLTEEIYAPSETIANDKCEDIPAVKIFQVLDNFSLANTCEYSKYTDNMYCNGYTVYVPKEKGELYFDEKIIKPGRDKCISFNGVYNYEAKSGQEKTVPKVKIVASEIPNPEYQKWLKEQEEDKE